MTRTNGAQEGKVTAFENGGFVVVQPSGTRRFPAIFVEQAEFLADRGQSIEVISHGQQIDISKHLALGNVTIVDFYADWCGPCKAVEPTIQQLSKSDPEIAVRKIDIVNWASPVATQYHVSSYSAGRDLRPQRTTRRHGERRRPRPGAAIRDSGEKCGEIEAQAVPDRELRITGTIGISRDSQLMLQSWQRAAALVSFVKDRTPANPRRAAPIMITKIANFLRLQVGRTSLGESSSVTFHPFGCCFESPGNKYHRDKPKEQVTQSRF